MKKADAYRETLRTLDDWEPYLLSQSGLPGRRGNIELAQAVAEEGDRTLFDRYRAFDAAQAPADDPYEFLAFCGVLGLGRLLAQGDRSLLPALRGHASDPRWRTREAVAMALQRWGAADMAALLEEMEAWSCGNPLEQRAAAAALCEPALLGDPAQVEQVLALLDRLMGDLAQAEDRRGKAFRVLRQGLGYCWSVAVAANPAAGMPMLERWAESQDPDHRWVLRQNLSKKRLARMDPDWVAEMKGRLDL